MERQNTRMRYIRTSLATIEAATDRENYNENQGNDDPKNYQFYLHIL